MNKDIEILRIWIQDGSVLVSVSFWISLSVLIAIAIIILLHSCRNRFSMQKLNIRLGNIGSIDIRPNIVDIQIAHKIWTELVTRKAAIRFDEENDVITDIYDSWYELFKQVRQFISEIPAEKIKRNKSTRQIVDISIKTLNEGLRPHLTKWQSRFRAWYDINKEQYSDLSPQQIQKKYPQYSDLIKDLTDVNNALIHYSEELRKMV